MPPTVFDKTLLIAHKELLMNTIKFASIAHSINACRAADITLCMLGAPGIGKTAGVREAATRLTATTGITHHVKVVELASISEVDVRGYVVPDGNKAIFTLPPFWPTPEQTHGILFLDELPQAAPEVQKAIASLLLERRIGDNVLPPGWQVVIAGNRVDDNAGANSFLSHVVNRLLIVEVEPPTIDELVAYLIGKDYGPEVPTFLKLRGGELLGKTPQQDNTPYFTHRSAEALAKLIEAWPGGRSEFASDGTAFALASGLIGSGAAVEFRAAVELFGKLPSYADIVADPTGAQVPEKIDHQYAAIMLCVTRAQLKDAGPVIRYLSRYAANYAMVGVAGLLRRDTKFGNTVEFANWGAANTDVIARLAKFANAK